MSCLESFPGEAIAGARKSDNKPVDVVAVVASCRSDGSAFFDHAVAAVVAAVAAAAGGAEFRLLFAISC